MASWPIRRPSGVASRSWYGCRSDPHTHACVTRTSASVGSEIVGSGTSSTRTSPAPYINVAFMSCLFRGVGGKVGQVVPASVAEDLPGDADGGHGLGPADVDRQVGDRFEELRLGDAVLA